MSPARTTAGSRLPASAREPALAQIALEVGKDLHISMGLGQGPLQALLLAAMLAWTEWKPTVFSFQST